MEEQKRSSRLGELYAGVVFLAYAVATLLHRGAPSLTDYANWTYQGVLLREHLLRHSDPTHLLKPYPVPNSLTTVGIGLLSLLGSGILAAKLWLVAQLAICFGCLRRLLHTVAAPPVAWIVVPQAVFLGVNFWYGFMNFVLGLAWLMLFASFLLRRSRWPALAALIILLFFTHMIPLLVGLLLLLADCWQIRQWARLRAAVPAIALTAWYVAGRFWFAGNADGQAGMQETVQRYSGAFWLFKVNSYLKSFGYVNPDGLCSRAFGHFGFVMLLLAALVLAGIAAWAMAQTFQRRWLNATQRGPLLLISSLAGIFLLLPSAMLGISDPGARVLQAGLALGLVLCWQQMRFSMKAAAGISAGLLMAAGLSLFLLYGGEQTPEQPVSIGVASGPAHFARVPHTDQDRYYDALERGDLTLSVFPTGLFLNQKAEPPQAARGGP